MTKTYATDAEICVEQLDDELTAAGIAHSGVSAHPGSLTVHGVETEADADAVDAVVSAHVPRTELERHKRALIERVYIELKRRLEDDASVEYPEDSGKRWPVCARGHRHWRAARSSALADRIVFPFVARTKNGLDEHVFADAFAVAELADLIDAEVVAQQQTAEAAIADILKRRAIKTATEAFKAYRRW